jgi:hypothetical protein
MRARGAKPHGKSATRPWSELVAVRPALDGGPVKPPEIG